MSYAHQTNERERDRERDAERRQDEQLRQQREEERIQRERRDQAALIAAWPAVWANPSGSSEAPVVEFGNGSGLPICNVDIIIGRQGVAGFTHTLHKPMLPPNAEHLVLWGDPINTL